jgi:hypothetical protein
MKIKSLSAIKQLLVWCLLVGTLASCGKDEDPTPLAELDYQPTSAGSTWSYGGQSPYTATSLGTTKTINGKIYYEFETKQGSTTYKSSVSKENGVYTSISENSRFGNLEITQLKENEPVGATWTNSGMVNGVTSNYKFTIAAKGITKTVEGKEFKDIIHVKLESTFTYMGQTFPYPEVFNYFYAKGVGLVLTEYGTNTLPLKTYTIK